MYVKGNTSRLRLWQLGQIGFAITSKRLTEFEYLLRKSLAARDRMDFDAEDDFLERLWDMWFSFSKADRKKADAISAAVGEERVTRPASASADPDVVYLAQNFLTVSKFPGLIRSSVSMTNHTPQTIFIFSEESNSSNTSKLDYRNIRASTNFNEANLCHVD